MAKQIMFDAEGRQKILAGVEKLAKAVTSTLGPGGRNVVIDKKFGSPQITKDGVTVAKEISLTDPFENIGVQMVKEVASKTNDTAGDGTTTATLLAYAIYKRGLKNVTAGANPTLLKRGIDYAVECTVNCLTKNAKEISTHDEIAQVATLSANGDTEIGNLIADAVTKVGKDGTITVDESKTTKMGLDVVEGMSFDRGWLSPYFITDSNKQICEIADPYILFFEKKISSIQELIPVLQGVAKSGKSLVIVAEDVDGEALATLVVNKLRGVMNVCAVKAPGYGDRRRDTLQDMAVVTGGTVISEELGIKLENVTLAQLGKAKKVIVAKDRTMIVGGTGTKEAIDARADQIRAAIAEAKSDYDKTQLENRLARLVSGVAVIHVGAMTEAEMKEKKDRVDDALHATRAAVEEGVVVGGGCALINCQKQIDAIDLDGRPQDFVTGFGIVYDVLEAPLRKLAENVGKGADLIVAKVREDPTNGYNVATDTFEDLIAAGVVDPTKVTRSALQNAASIAGLMLTADCLITDEKEEKPNGDTQPQM